MTTKNLISVGFKVSMLEHQKNLSFFLTHNLIKARFNFSQSFCMKASYNFFDDIYFNLGKTNIFNFILLFYKTQQKYNSYLHYI